MPGLWSKFSDHNCEPIVAYVCSFANTQKLVPDFDKTIIKHGHMTEGHCKQP